MSPPLDDRGIGDLQQRHQREEFRLALRALLMQPLMPPSHPDFVAVRRQGDRLREWFTRESGWALLIDREGARLFKRPADLEDSTRGLSGYTSQRYALLCLACAVLERADPQITLRVLGERLLTQAADPLLAGRGFTFTLTTQADRRGLVSVCRTLLDLGVLLRVAGTEEGFIQGGADQSDALYDVRRRQLSGVLAAVRGPSTWAPTEAPETLEHRLRSLVSEHVPDSDEGRHTAMRHHLTRRLLDDPVVYFDVLDRDVQAYFSNQRGVMAARLCDATGLVPEQRAEGLALADPDGALSDVTMPAEGTEAHATLLVADYLAGYLRGGAEATLNEEQVAAFLGNAREHYGRYWRKSAREPGGEIELAAIALDRLDQLRLVRREGREIHLLPALARFALGTPKVRRSPKQTSLLGDL